MENHKVMISLSVQAEAFNPEFAKYLQGEIFALVFRIILAKMTREIPA